MLKIGGVPIAAIHSRNMFKADYFVSYSLGNDNNDGLSVATPWKHHPWDLAATGVSDGTTIAAGKIVAMRQETHYVSLTTPGGTAATSILTVAHPNWGSGGAILSGSADPTTLTWTADGGSYKATVNANVNWVIYNGVKLTKQAGAGNAVELNKWDISGTTLYVNVGENPSLGTLLEANTQYVILAQKSNIEFRNLTIELGYGAGNIFTSSISDFVLRGCTVRYNATNGVYLFEGARNKVIDCTVYENGVNVNALNTSVPEIRGNTVYSAATNGVQMGGCTSGICHDNIIRNNLKYGVLVTNSSGDSVYQNQVFSNGVGQKGHGGDGAGVFIGGSSTGVLVYRNNVYSNYIGIYHNTSSGAGANKIYYNIVKNSTVNGIDNEADAGTNAVEIYNNTIIHSPNANNVAPYAGHGISSQVAGKINKIANNLVVIKQVGADCNGIAISSDVAGFVYAWIDNNLYFDDAGGSAKIGMLGAQYSTLSTWQAALQADAKIFDMGGNAAQGEAHGVYGDPLFVDAANGNYRLSVGSPAIGAGVAIAGLTTDYDGNSVSATTPCIGAFEYVS